MCWNFMNRVEPILLSFEVLFLPMPNPMMQNSNLRIPIDCKVKKWIGKGDKRSPWTHHRDRRQGPQFPYASPWRHGVCAHRQSRSASATRWPGMKCWASSWRGWLRGQDGDTSCRRSNVQVEVSRGSSFSVSERCGKFRLPTLRHCGQRDD